MRAHLPLLALLSLPLQAGPYTTAFSDSFQSTQMPDRRLERGDWKISGGVAGVTQDDALYKKYKNHGPIVFYDLRMQDARVSFEVKLEDAKRFVFTFNGKGGHVFRLLQNPDGSALLAFEDKDGKHTAVRLDTTAPHVENGKWIRYTIEMRGQTAKVTIGDSFSKTVEHPNLAAPKTNLSLSFHYGALQVRNLHVEPL